MNFFVRQAVRFNNDMARSCGALLGITQGILADGDVNDREIRFLQEWLAQNESIANAWPGNAIHAKITSILADGRVDELERQHLMETLQALVGGTLTELAESTHVSELALDQVGAVEIPDHRFCLTGDFAYGMRSTCERLITERGGEVAGSVSKKLHYLVVGGLGSPEWKHGSFGTKIAKAMEYKQAGVPLLIVHEDAWVAAIRG